MKNCLHVVWMMICLLFVSSCKDDNNNLEEAEREAYRAEQDIAFQAKANEPDVYKRWVSPAGDGGYVFAKLLKEGNGKQIYYNKWNIIYNGNRRNKQSRNKSSTKYRDRSNAI